MSFTRTSSSCPRSKVLSSTVAGSSWRPPYISAAARATRAGVSARPGRSGSSPTARRNSRAARSTRGRSTALPGTSTAVASSMTLRSRRFQPHHDGLGRRGAAGVRHGIQRHQHIGFRVVGSGATLGGRVGDDSELLGPALCSAEFRDQVDHIPVRKTHLGYVCLVDQYDPPAAVYTAVSVVLAVDGGVVLVM